VTVVYALDDYHKSNTLRDSRTREPPNVTQSPSYYEPPQPVDQIQVPLVNPRHQSGNRTHDNYQYGPPPGPPPGPLPGPLPGPPPGGVPHRPEAAPVYHPLASRNSQGLATQVTPSMHIEPSGDSAHPGHWQTHQPALSLDPSMDGRQGRPVHRPRQSQDSPPMENHYDRPDRPVPRPQPRQDYYSKQGGR